MGSMRGGQLQKNALSAPSVVSTMPADVGRVEDVSRQSLTNIYRKPANKNGRPKTGRIGEVGG